MMCPPPGIYGIVATGSSAAEQDQSIPAPNALRAADGRLSVGDCVEGQESVLPFPATAPIASLSANTQRRSERHNTRSLQFRSAGNRPGVMPPQWTKDRRAPRRASRDGG